MKGCFKGASGFRVLGLGLRVLGFRDFLRVGFVGRRLQV